MPVVLSRRLFFLPHFRYQFAEKAINLYGSFAFENGFISIPNRRVVVVVIVAVPVVVVIIVVFVAFIIANSLSARGECFSSKPRPGEPTSITGACVVVEFLFPLSIHNVIMYTQQQRQKLQSQLLAVVVVRGRCSTDTEQRKKNCPIRHQSRRRRRDRGSCCAALVKWMHPGGKELNHCLWREVCIILERTIFQQIHRWKKWTLKGLKCDTLAAGSSAVTEGQRIGDCKAYERRTS